MPGQNPFKRFPAVLHPLAFQPQGFKTAASADAGDLIVIHDQHSQPLKGSLIRRPVGLPQTDGGRKPAALAVLALRPDLSAHLLHNALTDRQPQAGALHGIDPQNAAVDFTLSDEDMAYLDGLTDTER